MPIQLFDDGQDKFIESVKTFGEAVGGLLKQRLHKKQYEDFLSGPTKELQSTLQQANDILLDEENPEGPSQGMTMLKTALETYMDEGARYGDNPMIQQRVAQTFKMNMDFLNMEFNQKFAAQKNEREKAEAKRQEEAHNVEMGLKRSEADLNKAKAGKATQEAAKADEAGMPQLFSGRPGSIEPMMEDPDRARELWTRIEATISNPGSEAQRKAVEFGKEDIRNQMASQRLADMAARGEIRPATPGEIGGTARPWDVFSQEDRAAVAATIDPVEVHNRYVMERAKSEAGYHGIKPEVLEAQYGVVVDPTKANAFRPLKQAVKSEDLGKVMFGVAGWDRLRDPKTNARPRSLTEAIDRLPENIGDMHGPIAQQFKEFQLPEGVDPSVLKTPDDVKALLAKQAMDLVAAVVGDNAPSETLDAGMRENRLEAMKLVSAMVDKYAEQVFERVTGKKRKPEGMSEAEAAKKNPLLGIAANRIGQVKRGVLKTVTDAYKEFAED